MCSLVNNTLSCYNVVMKKQPQLTEQTKQNLKTSFWKLYSEKNIDKISIKEITDLAGYHRGTFYLYYKDVYDLFEQIESELLSAIKHVIDEALETQETFDLTQQMGLLMSLSQTYADYVSVLLGERGDPKFASQLKEIIWPILNHYFLSTEGYSKSEVAILSEFYLSGILAAIVKWLTVREQMTIQQFIEFILPNIFKR